MAILVNVSAILMCAALAISAGWDQCPAHVKTDAPFKNASSLTRDGLFIYRGADKYLYRSKIKNYSATKMSSDALDMQRLTFSPDGKWVMGTLPVTGTKDREIAFLKADGSSVKRTGIKSKVPAFYYSSPIEKPSNGIYEIGYIDPSGLIAWAQIVNLSGVEPVLGGKRKIGDDLVLAGHEEFSVAGSSFLWDSRNLQSGATVVYTIPGSGLGTATHDMYYKVYAMFNCAVALNLTGTMWVANVGRLDDATNDCIPGSEGSHSGYVILKTKLNTDTKVSMKSWVLDTQSGAVSVNWAPLKVDGKTTRYAHGQGTSTFGWYAGQWTNDENYISANLTGLNAEAASTVFLLEWKTNSWIRLVPPAVTASSCIAWFDGIAYPPMKQSTSAAVFPVKRVTHARAEMLAVNRAIRKRDLTGRALSAPAQAAGMTAVKGNPLLQVR